MIRKESIDKNFTTRYAGLSIYQKLWNKFDLSAIFDSTVPKHSGSSFSAIMQNLFFRNLIDENSMSALSEADQKDYFLQQNASLDRTTYGRNLKKLNTEKIISFLLRFNARFISRDEIDDDTIMICDTTAIKAEGESYENTKRVYDACQEKMVRGYALEKLLLKTTKKLSVIDFDLQNNSKDALIEKFKRGRRLFGVDKVVFDPGPDFCGMEFYKKLDEEEILFYTKSISNWKFNHGKDLNVEEIRKNIKERLRKEGMVSIEVWKDDLALRLIFVHGDPRVFLTNDLEIPAGKVVRYYRWRWEIEVSFREEKQNLGLNKLPCWNEQGLRTHFLLCLLAFMLSQLIIMKVDIVNGIKLIKRRIIKVLAYVRDATLYFMGTFKLRWIFSLDFG